MGLRAWSKQIALDKRTNTEWYTPSSEHSLDWARLRVYIVSTWARFCRRKWKMCWSVMGNNRKTFTLNIMQWRKSIFTASLTQGAPRLILHFWVMCFFILLQYALSNVYKINCTLMSVSLYDPLHTGHSY